MTAVTPVRLDPAAEAFAFHGDEGTIHRIAVDAVTLHEGEVLVKIELATVCGSDLHTTAGHRPAKGVQVLGHEQVGHITAFGPGAPATTISGAPLHVGDRVVWGVAVACGLCRLCLRGIPNKCLQVIKYGHEPIRRGWELGGGIATHSHLLPRTPIVRVTSRLPAEVLAPASCATATVAAVIEAGAADRPLRGETVLVSGCGMLGLTAVAMATAAGSEVIAVDRDPERRELARAFGAREAHAPDRRVSGYGVAFELSGANAAVTAALDGADVGATVVLAGSVFTAPPVPVSAESVVRRLLTIRGVHNYRPEHLVAAVRYLEGADHAAFAGLVGTTVAFADAPTALTTPATAGTRIGVRP